MECWPGAVGPEIARNAWPARIGRDGTLHVATRDSIWAFELGHRAGELAGRVGVAKLRFAPGPLPGETPAAAAPVTPVPNEQDRRRAAEIAAAIDDENLRQSVQKAVSLSLARDTAHRPV